MSRRRIKGRTAGAAAFLLLAILLPVQPDAGATGAPPSPLSEILGRPTDRSVSINALADEDLDVYFEYGIQKGIYPEKTAPVRLAAGVPATTVLAALQPDARYYYRSRRRRPGEAESLAGEEGSFRTQRARGRAFRFDVEADPHLDENSDPDLFRRALANIQADEPDFLIDLGDTFFSEKQPVVNEATVTGRHVYLRTFFDRIGRTVPLFLALGNHEGEQGFLLDGTPANLAVWAARARVLHYPNPLPDGFYTGETLPATYIGLRQNYYAWEWGDVLFVVLDPYWYTTSRPSSDSWAMTLGATQFAWLKTTLLNSAARFKLVFCHQLVGGESKDGRGGAEASRYYEWGGSNADGSWGFDQRRPGWGGKPVHDLMVEAGVTAFFHGHDHFFAKQERDGIAYQLVPQPSHPGDSDPKASSFGYDDGVFLPSSGHIRVDVAGDRLTVEYVKAYRPQDEGQGRVNGATAYTYTLRSAGKKGGIRR